MILATLDTNSFSDSNKDLVKVCQSICMYVTFTSSQAYDKRLEHCLIIVNASWIIIQTSRKPRKTHIKVPAFVLQTYQQNMQTSSPTRNPRSFHSPPPVAIQGAEADPRPESNRLTDGVEMNHLATVCVLPHGNVEALGIVFVSVWEDSRNLKSWF